MPTAEAHVPTETPGRYLVQFCKHASKMSGPLRHRPRMHGAGGTPPEMRHVEWSETAGSLTLNWGRCTLQATPGTLTVHAEATSQEDLTRIQDLVTARLEKFGRRDHLTVTWHQTPAPPLSGADPHRA